MPQARSAGSSTRKPTAAKRTPAKPAAAKAGVSKPAAAKSAAAKSAGAKSRAVKSTAAKSTAARSTAAKASAAKPAASRAAAAKPAAKRAAGKASASSSRPHVTVNIDAAQVEAIAERLRKLNEKIIDFGREAGESTLANYERALKTIATGVQQSPAKDELEWISHLAASQAKFVREITDSWTKAARDRLK
ncbi:MAG: hypothetical protein KGL15_07390 [Acidobacteriota bacterium]|nr:hypothetical protein [Acidobacteriota bacterium]